MQTENITFSFILFATNVSKEGLASIKINDTVTTSHVISAPGLHRISATLDLELTREYQFELNLETSCNVRIDNVVVTWNENTVYYDPYWMDRDMSPNVIWDYKNEEAKETYLKSHKGSGVRTIQLDYETDGRASFLRNYAIVKTAQGIRDIKNETGPYTFKGPGSFSLNVRAPLSYWLLERLFKAI